MNLLTHPGSAHLLGASLESLHEESLFWFEEISFWQNEMTFLYKLLNQRLPLKPFPSEKLAALEKELVDIQSSRLDTAKKEIVKHERALAVLLQNPFSNDAERFREEHQRLFTQMYTIYDEIKGFKAKVYTLF